MRLIKIGLQLMVVALFVSGISACSIFGKSRQMQHNEQISGNIRLDATDEEEEIDYVTAGI